MKHLVSKYLLFFIIISCSEFPLSLVGQEIMWEKSFGGEHAEYLSDMQPSADFGFILGGSTLSGKTGGKSTRGGGNLDYWVCKMSEKGDFEWERNYGESGSDFMQGLVLTNDGGSMLYGTSDSEVGDTKKDSCRGIEDFWILKLNAKGDIQWQRTIGGSGIEKLFSATQTKDGGFILGGSSESHISGDKLVKNFGSMDYWIVKIDNEGKTQWDKSYGGIYFDELRVVRQTVDNGYIIGGYSNSPKSGTKLSDNNGDGDYWILKLNSKGDVEWEKCLGGTGDDQLYTLMQTHDGGYIAGGNSISPATFSKSKGNNKGVDFWVVKMDINGDVEWQETYNYGSHDILSSLVENNDHSFLIGGYSRSEYNTTKDEKGTNDYIALKITERGQVVWEFFVGSDGDDTLRKLMETRDGGYVLAGSSSISRSSGVRHSKLRFKPLQSRKIDRRERTKKPTATNDSENVFSDLSKNIDSEVELMKNTKNDLIDNIQEAVGVKDNTAIKAQYGLGKNPPISKTNAGLSTKSIRSGNGSSKAKLPSSGDKRINYGKSDYWIVKLKDKTKKQNDPPSIIEAFPNPTSELTNVVVNFEYVDGTATLVDIAGHVLQTFKINSRTIPVDLSQYQQGIYIINIKTESKSGSVKVIKYIK